MDNLRNKSLNVVMLPWLSHGHANRFLELAKRLTQELNNLSIHFCSTPIILKSIRDRLHHPRISLVEIHLPVTDLSPHLHTTKHLPSHLGPTLIQNFAQSGQTFAQLLETLKPDLLISDIFQPWAAKLARERSIPAAVFIGCTVDMSCCAHDYFAPGKEYPFPAIRPSEEKQPKLEGRYRDFLEPLVLSWQLSDFVIAKTFREIESIYIDYLSTLIGKEVVPVGPLVPDISSVSPGDSQEEEKVMQWLDRREQRSVVYVSFGSQWFMSYKEIEQLALGLELSGACFIWVARFPNGEQGDTSARELLHGLVQRVGPERGLVVTSWAPQRKILVHQNVACFLTHCGWSSVTEAMQAGTPMLALPMDFDQPVNAKLIVELGIGVEIRRHGPQNFAGEDVAASIKQILQSDHGVSVRKNAENLAVTIRNRKDDDIRNLADKIVGLVSHGQAA